ncbi:hypothetical protein RF11_01860 [Thelohanellus kitauei]|uniref:Uncharacterized protein n=1 Tax=Thelohanellus kitauei TaxID=669202 RepID=A0A0C2M820_THEKT|nr:hypothetical protein RF11_01860 [Thelohanellus kitauei]
MLHLIIIMMNTLIIIITFPIIQQQKPINDNCNKFSLTFVSISPILLFFVTIFEIYIFLCYHVRIKTSPFQIVCIVDKCEETEEGAQTETKPTAWNEKTLPLDVDLNNKNQTDLQEP